MKKFVGKQKKYFMTMLVLIVLCEILLRVNNMIIQSVGICLLPFIVTSGFLLLKNDQQNKIN